MIDKIDKQRRQENGNKEYFLIFRTPYFKNKNRTLIGSLCCQYVRWSRTFISKQRGGIQLILISNIQVYDSSTHRKNRVSKLTQPNDTSIYVSILLRFI